MKYSLKQIGPKIENGFTLIETMVAVTLLVISVAAPMSLASQSLSSAFYARDQVTAFHLAQEAIETVRSVRDSNVIRIVQGSVGINLFDGIPNTTGSPFTVDTRDNSMVLCIAGVCDALRNNGDLYGYGVGSGWKTTRFTRSVRVFELGSTGDEIRVSVTVKWNSGPFQERSFTMSENMYRWVISSDEG